VSSSANAVAGRGGLESGISPSAGHLRVARNRIDGTSDRLQPDRCSIDPAGRWPKRHLKGPNVDCWGTDPASRLLLFQYNDMSWWWYKDMFWRAIGLDSADVPDLIRRRLC
jgi:hypothetical protein